MEQRAPETQEEYAKESWLILNQIWQGLYGVRGTEDKGIVGVVKEHTREISRTKRTLYGLITFLIGAGMLSGYLYFG